MSEWVDTGHGDHEFIAMDVDAKSWEGSVRVIATVCCDLRGNGSQPADIAKKAVAAEQVLREAYEALRERNAPVLQWDCDQHSIARFGRWVLEADAEKWTVWVDSPGPVARLLMAGAITKRTESVVNRRAAENALREFGVTFRAEEE